MTTTPLPVPPAPEHLVGPVKVWREAVSIPTYEPMPADRNPMFLETRVYQGSSGRVYPLPFTDRIADRPVEKQWDAIHLENEHLRVMILPEIGGRIHLLRDRHRNYDLVYRQDVIKPALVALAGPWISGGIEFNWPQHHRPSTYMPAEAHIEEHSDGSVTVWLSEHEPMNRMKGMHGVCLHPGRAVLEVKARLYNRTPLTQTFLWWANVATRVHERYQSLFPPDVYYVADHAKRAMSRFPLAEGHYYGVNYGDRPKNGVPASQQPSQFEPTGEYAPNDLSWYANIPVPTSYMCMGTDADFFGGYDHAAGAGIVHVCSHHISPGKKQWTWGNHEFGYAWDRNLTDPDENGVRHPYIELMAGVYTDNQPDFSFLAPGETRTFSQFWYPIHDIGPACAANEHAAISIAGQKGAVRIGVAVTAPAAGCRIEVSANGKSVARFRRDIAPGRGLLETVRLKRVKAEELSVRIFDGDGRLLLSFTLKARVPADVPPAATEPPAPADIASSDELYITGLHLEQYRHATRMPELYWREALRRDAGDSRCNSAMGYWHLRRGEFERAEEHFRRAIARLTLRNPNPVTGEAHYGLGLALRYLGREDEAYDALYKSVWNEAQQSAGYFALAQIDCRRGQWQLALEHLDKSLARNSHHLKARSLKAICLRRLSRNDEADRVLNETLESDPLDYSTTFLLGRSLRCDTQVRLDLALDYAAAGLYDLAKEVLADVNPADAPGTAPLVHYYRAYFHARTGGKPGSHLAAAAAAAADYCFPARLEEIAILRFAMDVNRRDARAPYYLGNLYYDRRRHGEAIALWERAAKLDPSFSIVWRNLGIGYYNVQHDPIRARRAYDKAFNANPDDARLLYERDQLWKRIGFPPLKRLREMEKHAALVAQRDDLSIEHATLLNQLGRHEEALAVLQSRQFQPWEGGEGLALAQHVRTHLALGRKALAEGDPARARELFEAAVRVPENLGEARHPLANMSDILYWLGVACEGIGDRAQARRYWTTAARFEGDFQEMSVRTFSEMTYFRALSLQRLGRRREASRLLNDLLRYAQSLAKAPAKIDYFATSLPTMLLFHEDLQQRQLETSLYLQAQAEAGLNRPKQARRLLERLRKLNPNWPTDVL